MSEPCSPFFEMLKFRGKKTVFMESSQKHEYGTVVSKYLGSNYISSIILDNIM